MNASIVNFHEVKAIKIAKEADDVRSKSRAQTIEFARILNQSTDEYKVDPVHQATLLMAKAIDVLAVAGPVPSSVHDQHARASNLLQSVFRARADMLEKSVRIISADNVSSYQWDVDGVSL